MLIHRKKKVIFIVITVFCCLAKQSFIIYPDWCTAPTLAKKRFINGEGPKYQSMFVGSVCFSLLMYVLLSFHCLNWSDLCWMSLLDFSSSRSDCFIILIHTLNLLKSLTLLKLYWLKLVRQGEISTFDNVTLLADIVTDGCREDLKLNLNLNNQIINQ